MMVRLAFAVQMAVDPTLFIIDEALAVGDIYFQNKCNRALQRKLDDGMTLLLVSHSPASVRALCQSGLVLDRGRPMFLGPSDEAVNIYHALGDPVDSGAAGDDASPDDEEDAAVDPRAGELAIPQGLGRVQDEIGNRDIVITGCELFNADGLPCHEFTPGEPIRAGFTFRCRVDVRDALLGFAIRDKLNNVVAARTNVNQALEIGTLRKNVLYAVYLDLAGRLGTGEYLLDFGLGSVPDAAGSPTSYYHRVGGITSFGLSWDRRNVAFQGICDVDGVFEPPRPV